MGQYDNRHEITPELTNHVAALVDAAGGMWALARHVGVHGDTISRILQGTKKSVYTSTLETLYDVFPEDVAWQAEPVTLNILERSRSAGPPHAKVTIPFNEKDKYAAHLYEYRGWTKTEISLVLRMSGGRVTDAVGKCS